MATQTSPQDSVQKNFYSLKDGASACLHNLEYLVSKVSPLRHRKLLTSRSQLRLRYYIPVLFITAFSTFSAINQFIILSQANAGIVRFHSEPTNISPTQTASVSKTDALYGVKQDTHSATANSELPKKNNVALFMKTPDGNKSNVGNTANKPSAEVTLASFHKAPLIETHSPKEIKIEQGQTVSGQLQEIGVPASEALDVVKALGEHFDPRHVRAGQSFEIEYSKAYDDNGTVLKNVSKMTMPVSAAKQIVVYKENEIFKAKEIEKEVKTNISAGRASVKYSLYGSAAKANIPDEVIANMIKIFSWSVDFQRDIRSGDEIEILYETKETEDGIAIGYGDILYARLVTGGRDLSLYRHKMENGNVDYFDPKGSSIKRTLMKTPVDGARMSSGYGMRHHPVLGYNKMHKGVDFAAPRGTPIYAAGDGVITKAGRNGSYGNYIRIKHNSKLDTAYAHLNNIKSGLRAGSRVKQGQVIGFVGTTGRSTGPHLHYEVLLNGKQTNPRGVNVPTGETLTGAELKRFHANKVNFDQKFAKVTRGENYASIEAQPPFNN